MAKVNIDGLFEAPTYAYPWTRVGYHHIGYLARRAVEIIHQTRPDIVIAGDRGSRLFALGVLASYHLRYPGERFPTRGHRIHYARISSRHTDDHLPVSKRRQTDPETVKAAVQYVLRKGLQAGPPNHERDGKPKRSPTVVFVDNWQVYGGAGRLFAEAALAMGFPPEALTYITMVGKQMPADYPITHIVLDPARNETSTSDWHENDALSGVMYDLGDGVTPRVSAQLGPAREARVMVSALLTNYYRHFSQAVIAGTISPCEDGYAENTGLLGATTVVNNMRSRNK